MVHSVLVVVNRLDVALIIVLMVERTVRRVVCRVMAVSVVLRFTIVAVLRMAMLGIAVVRLICDAVFLRLRWNSLLWLRWNSLLWLRCNSFLWLHSNGLMRLVVMGWTVIACVMRDSLGMMHWGRIIAEGIVMFNRWHMDRLRVIA